MESLTEETWDVVIAGTGLVQSLLALSLSRSDLKILHVDENPYYGGVDAGLSLDEASAWAERHAVATGGFSSAEISQSSPKNAKLANSRAYTLSLNPQIVYAQSKFLPSLVSSTVNTQLEFMAVGSWWICRQGILQRVPSSREDVFADDAISRRDKIGLMKFLRFVVQDKPDNTEAQGDILEHEPLNIALSSRFKISPDLQLPIAALALTQQSVHETPVEAAVSRIRRHMTSVGYFGPGFGAVLAKYAGNAEIAQVCCRACAVGGGTYLLGFGVKGVAVHESNEHVQVSLTDGTCVTTRHLFSGVEDLPKDFINQILLQVPKTVQTYNHISIVSSPLRHLFPQTSENGTVPAAAIVWVTDTEDTETALTRPPICLQLHTEDTGECPAGQCIIYASTLLNNGTNASRAKDRLEFAVQQFLLAATGDETLTASTSTDNPTAELLWSMSYISTGSSHSETSSALLFDQTGRVLTFPPRKQDVAFDDDVLEIVKSAWKRIQGNEVGENEFLVFQDRSGNEAVDD